MTAKPLVRSGSLGGLLSGCSTPNRSRTNSQSASPTSSPRTTGIASCGSPHSLSRPPCHSPASPPSPLEGPASPLAGSSRPSRSVSFLVTSLSDHSPAEGTLSHNSPKGRTPKPASPVPVRRLSMSFGSLIQDRRLSSSSGSPTSRSRSKEALIQQWLCSGSLDSPGTAPTEPGLRDTVHLIRLQVDEEQEREELTADAGKALERLRAEHERAVEGLQKAQRAYQQTARQLADMLWLVAGPERAALEQAQGAEFLGLTMQLSFLGQEQQLRRHIVEECEAQWGPFGEALAFTGELCAARRAVEAEQRNEFKALQKAKQRETGMFFKFRAALSDLLSPKTPDDPRMRQVGLLRTSHLALVPPRRRDLEAFQFPGKAR